MLMTVNELKQFVQSSETDQVLKFKLSALESAIRGYTNNNFQIRYLRSVAVAVAPHSILTTGAVPFKAGDTLQISDSDIQNNMLLTVSAVADGIITVEEDICDKSGIVITKVHYPDDVKMGAVNMFKWDADNRDKAGIQSETISRHSVTYADANGNDSTMGYPKSVIGFLKPYMKARFGRGIIR